MAPTKRQAKGLGFALALAIASLLSLGTGSALAANFHVYEKSFGSAGSEDGQLSSNQGVAVDQDTGDLYVADAGNARIVKFDEDGGFIVAWGWGVDDGSSESQVCTSGCQAGESGNGAGQLSNPIAVAVDNSGGTNDGDLYVADSANNAILRFSSSGAYEAQITGSDSPGGAFASLSGLAVDGSGVLYAADNLNGPSGNARVMRFDTSGAYVPGSEFDTAYSSIQAIAVNPAGSLLYVINGSLELHRWNSDGTNETPSIDNSSFAVAVEPTSGDIYVWRFGPLARFDSSCDPTVSSPCSPAESFGTENTLFAPGLAVAEGGYLYVSDNGGSEIDAYAFPNVELPELTIGSPTSIGSSTVHLSGTVDTDNQPATYHFEYSTDEVEWKSFGNQGPITNSSPEAVSLDAKGLAPNTTYFVRLVAKSVAGEATSSGPNPSFTTDGLAPDIETTGATSVSDNSAQLNGTVDASNAQSTYFFEWGTADCSSNPCSSFPLSEDGDAGAGDYPVYRNQQLSGLAPNTTYHYRIVAENASGTSEGEDETFTTEAAPAPCPNAERIAEQGSALADCRAWEMVSPVDKNGGDALAIPTRTRAAADGNAVSFASFSAFGDVVGTNQQTEYIAKRTAQAGTNGWATHSITPLREPSAVNGSISGPGAANGYNFDFSDDLTTGVYTTFTNLAGDPMIDTLQGIYLRDDLLSPGSGSYQLLSSCPACVSPLPKSSTQRVFGVMATPDYGTVVFATQGMPRLTSDAPANNNRKLYEWDHGTLRYAGVLPNGEAAVRSIEGQLTNPVPTPYRTVSDVSDGHVHVFFTVPKSNGVSDVSGPIYRRTDGASTIKITTSERTDCADSPDCGGDGVPDPAPLQGFKNAEGVESPEEGEFQGASADGNRVFFNSQEPLTDDSLGGSNFYMYDATKPPSDPHNLTRMGSLADGGYLWGISADGKYVYWANQDSGQGDAPPFPPGSNIYMWHEGYVHYVGGLGDDGEARTDNSPNLMPAGPAVAQGRVSSDGHVLYFNAGDGQFLTSHNHGNNCDGAGCRETYIYNADSDKLACASCNSGGGPSGARAGAEVGFGVGEGVGNAKRRHHSLSDDGRFAFFSSRERLVPEDTNGKYDAYVYDTETGEQQLLSSGRSPSDSFFVEASPDGRNVFIDTAERLSRWDEGGNYDLYDARIGGGLPEPPIPPPGCEGDACLGSPAVPDDSTPASASFNGRGDQVTRRPTKRCRARKRAGKKAKARCAKRNKQRAKQSRGAGR